jgi:DNA topoisomerase-2
VAEEDEDEEPKVSKKKKTVEETYQKLDQIEHALQRPDMYIGAAKMVEGNKMWVYDKPEGMVFRYRVFVTSIPTLSKES